MVVEAARGCAANPLRSGLGALAIAVAVGTMAVVVTGLDGFARYTQRASARAFGSDTFVLARVTTSEVSRKELADKLARNRPVTRSDVRFLDRYTDGQVLYAPLAQTRADVTAGGRKFENASVSGTAATLFDIRDLGIARGRFLAADEEDRAAQVAVIGTDVADALFPGLDPLGRTVRIGGRGFDGDRHAGAPGLERRRLARSLRLDAAPGVRAGVRRARRACRSSPARRRSA